MALRVTLKRFMTMVYGIKMRLPQEWKDSFVIVKFDQGNERRLFIIP